MKSTSHVRACLSAACLLLLLAPNDQAQDLETASLRFVNATGAGDAVAVSVRGELLQARGYRSGEVTGRLELAAGPCPIRLSHPSLGHTSLTLDLEPGAARTVVALIEPATQADKARQPPRLTCHVLVQPLPGTPMQRRLQVVQATPQRHLDLRLAGRALRCRRLHAEVLNLEHPQPMLEHAGHPLGRLPFEEAGNGTLILFAEGDGPLRHLFFLEPAEQAEPLERP